MPGDSNKKPGCIKNVGCVGGFRKNMVCQRKKGTALTNREKFIDITLIGHSIIDNLNIEIII